MDKRLLIGILHFIECENESRGYGERIEADIVKKMSEYTNGRALQVDVRGMKRL